MFGVVDIAEVEVIAQVGVVQTTKDLAKAEVVIDVEGDLTQNVSTDSELHAPGDALGVNNIGVILEGHFLDVFWVVVIDEFEFLVEQRGAGQGEVGGGTYLGTEGSHTQVKEFHTYQNRNLEVGFIQGEGHCFFGKPSLAGVGDIQ